MGVFIRSTVKYAAKLAVYDATSTNAKNHHTALTIRPDMDRGEMLLPCCINAPSTNQNELEMLNSLTAVDDAGGMVWWSADSPAREKRHKEKERKSNICIISFFVLLRKMCYMCIWHMLYVLMWHSFAYKRMRARGWGAEMGVRSALFLN